MCSVVIDYLPRIECVGVPQLCCGGLVEAFSCDFLCVLVVGVFTAMMQSPPCLNLSASSTFLENDSYSSSLICGLSSLYFFLRQFLWYGSPSHSVKRESVWIGFLHLVQSLITDSPVLRSILHRVERLSGILDPFLFVRRLCIFSVLSFLCVHLVCGSDVYKVFCWDVFWCLCGHVVGFL